MSRSFKKVPGYVDRNPFMKRYSNKSLRRASRASLQAISDPNAYDHKVSSFSSFKRCSVNPYDICDWRFMCFSEKELMTYCVQRTLPDFEFVSYFTTKVKEYRKNLVSKEAVREYHKYLSK